MGIAALVYMGVERPKYHQRGTKFDSKANKEREQQRKYTESIASF